ncbi:MAG: DUF4382 domain-containing protein [Agarilytica sp.]
MKHFLAALFSLTLIACGGGGGSGSDGMGRLVVGLTDAPVDNADAVVVTFDAISIKPQSGPAVDIELVEAMSIDVLSYQGEDRVLLLDDVAVEPGDYNWMRLSVIEEDSYIEIDGLQFPLEIPSGAERGLQLNQGFGVAAGAVTDFTLDFDLRKSVHQEGTGDYKLRPTIRVINTLEMGSVSGTVAADLINSELCNNGDNNDTGNVVYFFNGTDQIPQDEQGAEGDPALSASVTYNSESDTYEFLAGFVAVGNYTAVFTCDASLDVATENNSDVVLFGDPINVSVTLGERSTIEFTASL